MHHRRQRQKRLTRHFVPILIVALMAATPPDAPAESIGRHWDDWVETLVPEGEEDTKMWVPARAVVDLTGDGLEDIVYFGQHPGCCIGEYGQDPEKMHILVRNEDGIMENRTGELMNGPPIVLQGGANNIFPADYNGDGRMDLFLEYSGQEVTGVDDPGGQNRLLLMGEDGRLLDVTETHLPQWTDKTHFSGVGDFDGDGDVDIFVNTLGMWNQQADGWKRETPGGTGYLMFNDGTGHFEVVADFGGGFDWPFFSIGPNGRLPEDEVYGHHWAIVPIDADGDGDLDLVLGDTTVFTPCPTLPNCENAEGRVILMNDGTGRFSRGPENMVPEWDPPAELVLKHQIEENHVLDVNNDGLDDLVLSKLDGPRWDGGHPTPQYLQFLISNGDGTFRDESEARFEHGYFAANYGFQFHDLDRDGYKDLMIAIAAEPKDPGLKQVHINDGEGYFRQARYIFMDSRPTGDILPLDVDGDGDTDFFDLGFQWKEGGARYILHKMNFPYGAELDGFTDNDHDDANYLIGGAWDNVYRGLAGDDLLDGGLGDDYLDGGPGDDQLIGGKGDEVLVSGAGTDTVDGGPGRDRIEYPFVMDEAEILYSAVSHISRGNDSMDEIRRTEYALFSDGATPLPTAGQSEINSLNGIAGLWYDPALDGEGFNLITAPSGTVFFFYGYTAEGQRLWLISDTLVTDFGFEQVLDLTMYEAQGGTFDQPAPSSESLSEWGRLKALFDACGSGRLALHGEDGVKATYQVKLAGISDADCQKEQLAAPSGLAGLWYDSALDGEGYNVIVTNNSTVFFFYGYASDGQRLWLISETLPGAPQIGETVNLTVYSASGGTFDAPKPSSEALVEWGGLNVTFTACDAATATLMGADGDKTSSLVKLAGITDSTCPQ